MRPYDSREFVRDRTIWGARAVTDGMGISAPSSLNAKVGGGAVLVDEFLMSDSAFYVP